jgi:hypothetical protein
VSTAKPDEPIVQSLVTGAGAHEPPDPDVYDAAGRPRAAAPGRLTVRILHEIRRGRAILAPGVLVDVPDDEAASLIETGVAVPVVDDVVGREQR